MCGRYASTRRPEDLVDLFEVDNWDAEHAPEPNYNVAPTDEVWAVLEAADRETGVVERQLRPLRWGLVPFWAKTPKVGAKMINARVETVHEKPAYRRAFARRRCLLPADGFYEWQSVPATETHKAYKQPYFISPEDGQVMAPAGLYEIWRDPERDKDDPEGWWRTCTVITTEAKDAAGRIHPRMPLALDPADQAAWLHPAHDDPEELRALLTSPAGGHLDVRPVSTAVNDVRNNGPHLLDPAETRD
jgi:putative SOS response-associated peptidase YedK